MLTAAIASTCVLAVAQPTVAPPTTPKEEVVQLSPFEVSTTSDVGYLATSTLAGSRLNTSLRDIASQVSIMTPEFLEDIAATTFTDAARYSLNIENLDEFQSPTSGGSNFNDGVISNGNMTRVRGLQSAGLSHDFFISAVPMDTYNTERFTLSSGPNAILFGLGSPSGQVDTTFKRARLDRVRGSVSVRTDSERSLRTIFDANVPLLKKRFALRFVYLRQDENYFRRPAGTDDERRFATLIFEPFRDTRIRGWYEKVASEAYPMRNMVIRDSLTPWLAAGSPVFDNGGLTVTSAAALATNRINAAGQQLIFARYGNASPVYSVGGTAAGNFIAQWQNTVSSRGPDAALPTPDTGQPQSLADSTVFPWDVTYGGNGTRKLTDASIAGFTVEQKLFDRVFIEAGYNKESMTTTFVDSVQGLSTTLLVDANRFLPDGVTPNPNVGRYYFQSVPRAGINYGEREEARITASYDLDLTRRSKWFGKHRVALLQSRELTLGTDGQNFNLSIISDHPYTVGSAATDLRHASRAMQVRAYVDNPRDPASQGIYWVNLPFDPFENVTLPDGTRLASVNNPHGGTGSTLITKGRTDGTMFVMQNHWWDGRIVTTAGWRRDTRKEANLRAPAKGPGNAPFVRFSELLDKVPGYDRSVSKGTRTLGVVVHPWRWVSLHYNESNSASVTDSGRNPDGSIIPGRHGVGEDYGLTLAPFDNRVNLRINYYDSTSGPQNSAQFTSRIRSPISSIEETVQSLGEAPPQVDLSSGDASLVTIVPISTRSKGYEVQLIANPLPTWRVSLGAAKSESMSWDIGRAWISYVKERSAVWARHPDAFLVSSPGRTVRQEFTGVVQALNEMTQVDGASVESGRAWRINATTRYGFTQGWLKRSFVGGSYQYRGPNTIGYVTQEIPNNFPFPGIGDRIQSADITKPVRGGSLTTLDAFAGYTTKLWRDRIAWRLQLNVRNLFDERETVPLTSYSNGTVRLFTITAPRQFILTSSFEY